MTDRHQARKNLCDILQAHQVRFWTNGDTSLSREMRYSGAVRFKVIFNPANRQNPSLIYPEEINSLEDIACLGDLLKDIRAADSIPPAYQVVGKTNIPFDSLAVGNQHAYVHGSFYPFDLEGAPLTENILTLLSVIKAHDQIKVGLGIVGKGGELRLAPDLSSAKWEYHPDSISNVQNWLSARRVKSWASPDSALDSPLLGIVISTGNEYHFVLVSNGEDLDLAKQYSMTPAAIRRILEHPIKINGFPIQISSVMIGSPYSREGRLFREDRLGLSHSSHENVDMPAGEFGKSFYFTRLPFYLHNKGDKGPFVNTLLSGKLSASGDDYPAYSKKYLYNGNPLHNPLNRIPSSYI